MKMLVMLGPLGKGCKYCEIRIWHANCLIVFNKTYTNLKL